MSCTVKKIDRTVCCHMYLGEALLSGLDCHYSSSLG